MDQILIFDITPFQDNIKKRSRDKPNSKLKVVKYTIEGDQANESVLDRIKENKASKY